MAIFLDSNMLLRYITQDDPVAQEKSAAIIHKIDSGEEEAFITDVHLHEVAYVLAARSLYGLTHSDASEKIRPILLMKGLKMRNKAICLEALSLFATHQYLDFADALAVIYTRRSQPSIILSFDTDFDRITEITRKESW